MKSNSSIRHNDKFLVICISLIWMTMIYSSIIQQKYIKIPNAMLILGIGIIISYICGLKEGAVPIKFIFPKECFWMIGFMIYMITIGTLVSPNKNGHIAQWITGFEFLLIMMVVSSIVKITGTESIHALLLIIAIASAIVFLIDPVYHTSGRYALSLYMNSNGLGMTFSAGIWAALFFQQKKKINLVFTAVIVAVFSYCIVLTGSRKSLISAGIIIFLWLIFCYFPSLKNRGVVNILIGIVLIAILIIVIRILFMGFYSGSTMEYRMRFLQEEAVEGARNTLYKFGWSLFKQNPIFGLGFRGFQYYYGSYSHATLVEIPVSGGIIGSVIYFGTYVISIKKCIELYIKTRSDVNLIEENRIIRMIIVLWGVMLFYSTCIIHQYQFDSFILFGLIFGQTAYLENKINNIDNKEYIFPYRCRWIKY